MGLLPREGKFFDLFNQHAERIVRAGVLTIPCAASIRALAWWAAHRQL